jgi:hypothetical protein
VHFQTDDRLSGGLVLRVSSIRSSGRAGHPTAAFVI